MGAILDAVLGPRCDMCGHRVDAVFIVEKGSSLRVCAKCKRSLKAADRSGGPSAGTGRPPHLAGPMGGRYRGPEPKLQRRR